MKSVMSDRTWAAVRDRRGQQAWAREHNDRMLRVRAILKAYPQMTRSEALRAVEGGRPQA